MNGVIKNPENKIIIKYIITKNYSFPSSIFYNPIYQHHNQQVIMLQNMIFCLNSIYHFFVQINYFLHILVDIDQLFNKII